jgi:hypothetical protein
MDRIIAVNSVPFASADTAPATGTPQYGTSGNPATNTPATVFPAYAWNAIQDEILNVILGAGLTPNRNAWNQLLAAIQLLLQGGGTNVGADTGAANAYVVAFAPALPAPIPWVPFWFKVKTTNTGPSTLNATGTVEPLVGGAHLALQGNELVANGDALVYWNPTLASGAGSYVLMFCSGAAEQIAPATQSQHAVQLGQIPQIQPVSAAVASNALTLTLNPTMLAFRSATLSSGTVSPIVINSALPLTVPSGATLGTSSGVAATLAVLAINNGGTVQLGVVNMAGGTIPDEGALISATAISASATSASTIYSSSAVTNCPFRVVGYITVSETTAGTWATAPTIVNGASLPLLGFGASFTLASSTGYTKLPNGLIIQWGQAVTSTGATTPYYNQLTFPITFPTACLQAYATDSGQSLFVFGCATLSKTGMTLWGTNNGGIGRWIAIGC